MKLTKRQKDILKLIVEQYVKTCEAVGSVSLMKMLTYEVSSATIRNEMAYLEREGLIIKEYSSAGRIPSTRGYKEYVEYIKAMPMSESFPLIDSIFNRSLISREKSLKEAMMLISELTHYTTLIIQQNKHDIKIKKLSVVKINERLAVLILVTDQGYVESKKILLPEALLYQDLEKAVKVLNEALENEYIKDITAIVKSKLGEINLTGDVEIYDELINSLIVAFSEMAKDKVFVFGRHHFLSQKEFSDSSKAKTLVELLSHDEVVKICLKNTNDLKILVGEENALAEFKDCSIISIPYYDDVAAKGVIAVIGPKRMDYQIVIAMLTYIARNLKKEEETSGKRGA